MTFPCCTKRGRPYGSARSKKPLKKRWCRWETPRLERQLAGPSYVVEPRGFGKRREERRRSWCCRSVGASGVNSGLGVCSTACRVIQCRDLSSRCCCSFILYIVLIRSGRAPVYRLPRYLDVSLLSNKRNNTTSSAAATCLVPLTLG